MSAAAIDVRLGASRLLAAALLVLVLPSELALGAPQRPKAPAAAPALVLFPGTLKQARGLGAERNVPIVAIPLLDEEAENVAARKELLASPEIAALSQRCVLFFSNHVQHPLKQLVETVDGATRTRSVCSAFLTESCKEHQQHWDEIYKEYNEEGELRCPQVLILQPDGQIAQRLAPGHKPEASAIVGAVAEVQAKMGRGLSATELLQLKEALAGAARAETAAQSGSAWRAFARVLELSPDGARAVAAKEGQQRALALLARARAASEAKLAGEQRLAGYLELEALAADWNGTDPGADLTRLLRRAEKEPQLREALAKKKREDEAQALWNEAEVHTKAGQSKDAERKLRLLLRKYPGTQAYERAAKQHPDWVPGKTDAK